MNDLKMQNELRVAATKLGKRENRDKQLKNHPEAHASICVCLCDRTIVTMITIYGSENVLSIAYVCAMRHHLRLPHIYWYLSMIGRKWNAYERDLEKPEKPNRIYRYKSP